MHAFLIRAHRPATIVLLIVGVLGVLPLATALGPAYAAPLHGPEWPALAMPLLRQAQVLGALLGAALVMAVVWPALRPAAIGAAVLAKVAFVLSVQAAPAALPWLASAAWMEAALALALCAAAAVLLWPEPW